MVVLMMVSMSRCTPRSYYSQCAVDQCHKPDDIHILTGDMGMHYESHSSEPSLYGTPDNVSTDVCSPMLHVVTQSALSLPGSLKRAERIALIVFN